ncbi:MAG: aminotransferase class V-fold PLP-dependent enzyme [Thermoplasmata archaeon]
MTNSDRRLGPSVPSTLEAPALPAEAPLREATERSLRFLRSLDERRVSPTLNDIQGLDALDGALPEAGQDPRRVIEILDDRGSPAAVGCAGGRYFGFVIGSALPAALAANWLAGAWNQNTAFFGASPVAARLEEIALRWSRDLLQLPAGSEGAFVTGATMANFTGLAAARHTVLANVGWDVEELGLAGSPPITVVVGEEAHASLLKAVSMLGLGRGRVLRVSVDSQGRMRADAIPPLTTPAIVCVQAGNVNSGAFDPIGEISTRVKSAGAWVHVDGAFGLRASVAPKRRYLTAGVELADSWATDGHKWLNVPYDSGLVFVRNPPDLLASMSIGPAAYLVKSDRREPSHFTPELSRRARGVDTWAAIQSLGRRGLAELVERTCAFATRFAEGLHAAGYEILNEVELNQVLVAFGDDDATARVIAGVQEDGTCWCGGTRWHGRSAMRISVSSWATTQDDVDRSLAAILRIADRTRLRS